MTAKKNLYAKVDEMSGSYYLFLFNDQLIVSQPTKHHQYQYIRCVCALARMSHFKYLTVIVSFVRSWLLEACSVIEMEEGNN